MKEDFRCLPLQAEFGKSQACPTLCSLRIISAAKFWTFLEGTYICSNLQHRILPRLTV
jgi:hypothetical protein